METKKYTQFGTFTVAVLAPILLFFVFRLIKLSGNQGPQTIVFLIVASTMLIALLNFYKLTIFIDNNYFSFKLGIGLIGKSYKLSDIKSCTPVRNSAFLGIGIRMLGNGWLYNVTGLKAIELQFYSKDSIVRIGTNRPEEISEVVNGLITKYEHYESPDAIQRKRVKPHYVFLLVVAAIVIGMIMWGSREIEVKVDNQNLTINSVYGITIPLSDIIQVDTITSLPGISEKINGFDDFGGTRRGSFRLVDNNSVKLFIKPGHPPFLLIKSKDNGRIYLNFKDKQKTRNLYMELKEKK